MQMYTIGIEQKAEHKAWTMERERTWSCEYEVQGTSGFILNISVFI